MIVAMRAALVATIALGCAVVMPAGAAAAQSPLLASPYEYLGWGDPQPPGEVVRVGGVESVTLAFILADHGCHPAWDGQRPLAGGRDEAAIDEIRAAGGEVVVSFGGWSGAKLGARCKSVNELAAAYEAVVTAYSLKAIDIDIEAHEISSAAVRARVAQALALVQRRHPELQISITFAANEAGPEAAQRLLIADAAAAGLHPYAWTVMPFDFGAPRTTMFAATRSAVEGLVADLVADYGLSEAEAWSSSGVSTMNGRTDQASETVTVPEFAAMLAFAAEHHLARMSFWSVNRDRACSEDRECSHITQTPLEFTQLLAGFGA